MLDYKSIEAKWLAEWRKNEIYKVTEDTSKPKYYVLDMFPYPSGAGLHVGHPLGYIASDIYARHKRMSGYNVLHPMGFDAFGLPAEEYALQTGIHPADSTQENMVRYREQLSALGFSFDWSRELYTCDPNYYKWTQWIFIQLFNHYLAYRKVGYVNWCEELGTVLANDQVKDGLSERGGYPVIQKAMTQWYLRITAYADRLLYDLDKVDWSHALKTMQSNWIGRSEGASVWFDIEGSDEKIEIFTTRIDTIYGATYMVLAPEHDLVAELTTDDQKQAVKDYISYVQSKSEIDRMAEKEVTGAFIGAYAINPFNQARVPIWIGEYVLKDYGTGAIMAVPSDDDRDKAFAQKFGLEIIDVVDKSDYPDATLSDKLGKIINSDFLNGMEVKDAILAGCAKAEELGVGKAVASYKMRDANFSRQRYWGEPFPMTFDEEGIAYPVAEENLPVTLPNTDDFKPAKGGQSPLGRLTSWVTMSNGHTRETDTMPAVAGSSWYYLRYMDPNNADAFADQDKINYWESVDLYIGGAEHAVAHLLYARFWHKFLYDKGLVPTTEPFKKLVNQGMIQGVIEFILLEKREDGKKVFVSADAVKEDQDYAKIPVHIEVGKMSKSKFNVINPDDVVSHYGTDCFRMYEMFLGPIEQAKPWDTKGIDGVSKFLRKFIDMFYNKQDQFDVSDATASKDELKALHTCIKKVTSDIEAFSFNTGVSAMMIAVNDLRKLKCNKRSILGPMVKLIAPFAPFISEELWNLLGESGSVHHAAYPTHDESFLVEDTITYPLCINGKKRDTATFDASLSKDEIEAEVRGMESLQKWIEGKAIRKVIVVPGRMVNIVI
ncbi:UNVERIFIED_CONTAM: hypothetical protein GTU68_060213 [Idotea baltica]|nr:hypothetical protein [Idotea baltica]